MSLFNLQDAAQMAGGMARGQADIVRVSTDSRQILPGDLFVALRGERFDGHAFAANALLAGAAAVMIDRDEYVGLQPSIVVQDTRLALGRMAAAWRKRQVLKMAAITGSSGKTTVKEMLASIMRHAAGTSAVLATKGNLNNDIGVPLTLLQLTAEHRYAVIEMGMNHAGELDYLSRLAGADLVLVNNAGHAHVGMLGSVEAVARAKGEIITGSPGGAVVVINADDAYAGLWRELAASRPIMTFGLEKQAQCRATFELQAESSLVHLESPAGAADFCLPVAGRHNVMNALAAACAAQGLGIGLEDIVAGLEAFSAPAGRQVSLRLANGATLIDDTYNANPESVRAAIEVLAGRSGQRWLVLGDMGELGDASLEAHRQLGEYASKQGIDRLFTLGEDSRVAATAFGKNGRSYLQLEDLLTDLRSGLGGDVTVLVKGSRFMRMERVIQELKGSD